MKNSRRFFKLVQPMTSKDGYQARSSVVFFPARMKFSDPHGSKEPNVDVHVQDKNRQ